MPRKKIDLGYTPSKYQEKFFDFIQHGNGNAVVSATAGSGKTTTIVSAIKLIPKKEKCLFIAFNRSIVGELQEKLTGNDNVHVRTAHSLGLIIVKRNLGNDIEINEHKYRSYIKHHICEISTCDFETMTRHEINDYIDSVTMLVDYSRFNIAQSVEEIEKVANKYDIPYSHDECYAALRCLEWGKTNTETIDYTDMVWLPYELSLKPIGCQYDWVMIDECQDMSLLTIQLFLKCFKRGTRFVAVGDRNQAIYAFAGASEEAFDYMCNYKNTQEFSLPISYRCDKSIVDLANNYVPEMQSRENADEGKVITNVSINNIKEGDMVLSRTKAPLVKLYIKLLRRGQKCYIKGQDIDKSLLELLDSIETKELNPNLDKDGVFVRLYEKLFDSRDKLMEKRGLDLIDATLSSNVMNLYDSINALLILSEKCRTKDELIRHINTIFKKTENGICLSTIHKSKGLEYNNVYILCHSAMPSKLVKHDWEKKQENNLIYVAYTRAKHTLGFVSEKEIPPTGSMLDPMEIINDLNYIERKVCQINGKECKSQMSEVELINYKPKNIVNETYDIHDSDNVVVLDENKEEENNFTEFLNSFKNISKEKQEKFLNMLKNGVI